jgi:hypothetical protein
MKKEVFELVIKHFILAHSGVLSLLLSFPAYAEPFYGEYPANATPLLVIHATADGGMPLKTFFDNSQYKYIRIAQEQVIDIEEELLVDTEHAGKQGFLYVVARYGDNFFMKVATGQWLLWKGDFETLAPFEHRELTRRSQLNLREPMTGLLGRIEMYAGYRVKGDNNYYYNTIPFEMNVTPTVPKYLKLNAVGQALPDSSPEWHCVKDKLTNLIWEVKTKEDGLRDWKKRYSHYSNLYDPYHLYRSASDATGYVATVNQQSLCGLQRWRLPSTSELDMLREDYYYSVLYKSYFKDIEFPVAVDYGYVGELFWSSVNAGTAAGCFSVGFHDDTATTALTGELSSAMNLYKNYCSSPQLVRLVHDVMPH